MKLIIADNCGFCFGVQNAVDIAVKSAREFTNVYSYGELIHSGIVREKLKKLGVTIITDFNALKLGDTVIIRSHGVPKKDYESMQKAGLNVVDATCPFVKKIHSIAEKYAEQGYHIVIIGKEDHPEVTGIAGYCGQSFTVIDEHTDFSVFKSYEKLCFVCQTTFDALKYKDILKKIEKHRFKTVEIFDTICYTTYKRQLEAAQISAKCDIMLILGSRTSSNTTKLYDICSKICKTCFLLEEAGQIKDIKINPSAVIGIVAGASTPRELILEVKEFMGLKFEEVQSKEFIDGVEESLVSYKEGKRVKGTVIFAGDDGIKLNIGGKKDGFIPKDEVNMDGLYDSAEFPRDALVEAVIINKQDAESGCILLSKKKVDQIKEGDKVVETIRGGEVFEFKADKETKGGLLGKLGTYTVFIPASQIKESFVKDLKIFVGKPLRLTAVEIDDNRRKIVASQRKVLEKERTEREEIFWSHVQPDVIVSGKVKRITNFGAFVSVDGFDCLAHIVDLSWNHIKSVEEVMKIGETHDFLVLSVDKEKGRVSLSYKLLQPHPFEKCLERHPIGSVCKGKVTSIVPFGAFVEIEPGIEGLVHVSEASHTFVKSVADVVKAGEEVEVMIMNADPQNKKINLSIKAAKPEAAPEVSEVKETDNKKAAKASKKDGEGEAVNEWSDDANNTPFAELLKNLDVKK